VEPPFQQADGAYAQMPKEIDFVHSMEHSRVEMQYAPNLPDQDQLLMKGIFDESPSGVLLFPNTKMPYQVAETAWQNLMGCKQWKGSATLDALRDFRDRFRGTAGREFGFPINP
jgi:hypothetical protein